MGPSVSPSAAWVLPAEPSAVTQLRRRAAEFASTAGASDEVTQAIVLAVSETVTNAVVHAYDGDARGPVRVRCYVDRERFVVEVADEGVGIASGRGSPGIGHGLATVGALAQTLNIATGPDGRGTVVTMGFGTVASAAAPPGLEMLCGLALETVADVSNVDLVQEGVLRRVAAEVADDPALTAWLRTAVPPAKPGTATWSALREGGARLVVHDPTVPRSPGGTGERLNLMWWVAVALEKPDGTPAALWGLGGRDGGHPVPPEEVIRILADAAHGDLTEPAERACCAPSWRRPAVRVPCRSPPTAWRRHGPARSDTRACCDRATTRETDGRVRVCPPPRSRMLSLSTGRGSWCRAMRGRRKRSSSMGCDRHDPPLDPNVLDGCPTAGSG